MYLHRLPELSQQLGVHLPSNQTEHILTSLVLLFTPGLFAYATHQACKIVGGDKWSSAITVDKSQATAVLQEAHTSSFVEVSYAYLPLAWGATLAHYWALLLGEGGHVAQVSCCQGALTSVTMVSTAALDRAMAAH